VVVWGAKIYFSLNKIIKKKKGGWTMKYMMDILMIPKGHCGCPFPSQILYYILILKIEGKIK